MTRLPMLLAVLTLLLASPAPTAASEPPLRVVASTDAPAYMAGDQVVITVTLFSTAPTPSTTTLAVLLPSDLSYVDGDGGVGELAELYPQPHTGQALIHWSGPAWQDHPATIQLTLQLAGDASSIGDWRELRFWGHDARDETTQTSLPYYVGREEVPPLRPPLLFVPIAGC